MKINKPYLFIELNDKKFIFLIVEYNEDLDFKILDATEVFAAVHNPGMLADFDDLHIGKWLEATEHMEL